MPNEQQTMEKIEKQTVAALIECDCSECTSFRFAFDKGDSKIRAKTIASAWMTVKVSQCHCKVQAKNQNDSDI